MVPPSAQTWNEEKRKLINKIASLQSENQRTVRQLKAKEAECTAKSAENEKMHQNFSDKTTSLSNENSSLQSQLQNTETELNASKKIVSNLKLEKQKLNAVIKQLKTGTTRSNASRDRNDLMNDDSSYEVEKLLEHKYKKDGIWYLTRWKNYSADDDTWQKESDFQCQALTEYKRKMKLDRK